MAGHDEVPAGWHKSTWSTDTGCVEVRVGTDRVHVRDSKDREGAVLTFTSAEWRAFLAGVHGGEFELPAVACPP